jgi:hypothetical protein
MEDNFKELNSNMKDADAIQTGSTIAAVNQEEII